MRSRGSESATLVLSSLEDVQRLRASPARLWALDGRLEIRIPDLPSSDRLRLEARLHHLAGICGCAEGAAAGASTLIIVIVAWMQRDVTFTVQAAFTAGACVLGASLLVKYLRVLTAQVQIRSVLDRLLRSVPVRVQPDGREVTS